MATIDELLKMQRLSSLVGKGDSNDLNSLSMYGLFGNQDDEFSRAQKARQTLGALAIQSAQQNQGWASPLLAAFGGAMSAYNPPNPAVEQRNRQLSLYMQELQKQKQAEDSAKQMFGSQLQGLIGNKNATIEDFSRLYASNPEQGKAYDVLGIGEKVTKKQGSSPVQDLINGGQSSGEALATLQQSNPYYAKVLTEVYEGRRQVNPRSKEGNQILNDVSAVFPDFSQQNYDVRLSTQKDFSSGKESQNIKSLNTGIHHLAKLGEASKALNSGDVQAVNRIANYFKTEYGLSRVPNFDMIKTAVASELATTFKGAAGTDPEIAALSSAINTAASPKVLSSVIDDAIGLIGGRGTAIGEKWSRVFPDNPYEVIGQSGRDILGQHGWSYNPKNYTVSKRGGKNPALAAQVGSLIDGGPVNAAPQVIINNSGKRDYSQFIYPHVGK